MAPRTRRAAAQKQSHPDLDITTPPSKKKFGGVLASLSHNVPAVKNAKASSRETVDRSDAETLESYNETELKTPHPPRSVIVGKGDNFCSPLTQPRIPKSQAYPKSPDKSMEDETSAASSEAFSPLPKGRLARKQRVIEDDSSSSEEEQEQEGDDDDEDDETLEMDKDDIDEIDPNETLLESEASEEEDDESEDEVESEAESEEDYESDTEEDFEDSDECEPDDDEYVPEEEDEEDSVSDDDFDDYIEEEKDTLKPPPRKRRPEEKPSTSESQEESKPSSDFPDDIAESCEAQSIGECAADDATHNEHTPAKLSTSSDKRVSLDSPEPEVAVLVDEDDFDDDDDILVATILSDDEEEQEELEAGRKSTGVEGTTSDGDEDKADESPCFVDDADDDTDDDAADADDDFVPLEKDEGGHVSIESREKTKEQSISVVSREEIVSDGKGKDVSLSSRENDPKSDVPISQGTPEPKRRKARKSFFRMEGLVKRGRWKLGSKIGVGSFGVVHVGMNNETGKLMAVKKFKVDDTVMQDVRREIELMKSLDHQNIVRYLGAQMDKTHLHIFQEWVPGGSVATLLGRFGPFTIQVIQSYLSQTLSGLVYLHENDIMHRDIKGSNILVNDEGIVKLADFGASKKLSNLSANLMMSLTVRGTPYFMSPEVFEEKYSAKADIWGIGCVAHQMITGSPPWKDKGFSNPISLFNHIKKHTGPPPVDDEHKDRLLNEDKNVYSFLCDLLDRCFSKDPESRPDARDLMQHKFFTEMHRDVDDESIYSRGLFSPANEKTSSPSSQQSLEGDSEIVETPSPSPLRLPAQTPPKSLPRSKSVVQWRTSFASPALPKRATSKNKQSPLGSSPYQSPEPDTSNWPDWARAEIQKRNLFEGSPSRQSVPVNEESNLSAMMGSLALSEDSEFASGNPYRRESHGRVSTIGTTAEESKLAGLSLLNDSNATYEI